MASLSSEQQEFYYYYDGEDETEGSSWYVAANENEDNNDDNNSMNGFEIGNRNVSSRLPLTICDYNFQKNLMIKNNLTSSAMPSRKREGGNDSEEAVANSACGGSVRKSRKLDDTEMEDDSDNIQISVAAMEEIVIQEEEDDDDVVIVYEGKGGSSEEDGCVVVNEEQGSTLPGPSARTTVIFRNPAAESNTNDINRLQEEIETIRRENEALKEENGNLKSSMSFLESEKAVAKEEWESQLLQAMDGEFQCLICTEIVIEPVTWKCGHIFCAHCIVTWFGERGSGYRCPTCREYWGMHKIPLKGLGKFISTVYNSMSTENLKNRKDLIQQRIAEKNELVRKRTIQSGRIRRLNFHAPPRSQQNHNARFRVETRPSHNTEQLRTVSSSPAASEAVLNLSSDQASTASFSSDSDNSSRSSSPTYSVPDLVGQQFIRAGIRNNNQLLEVTPPPQAISESFLVQSAHSPSPLLRGPPPPAPFQIFPQPVVRIHGEDIIGNYQVLPTRRSSTRRRQQPPRN